MIKYSTDELVEEIKKPTWDYVSGELDDIIIAQLRAADSLCEAAKEAMPYLIRNAHHAKLSKAIAEYEGKEKP
jgi:poly-beta-hydroxyalkanoate depolymerase